MDGPSLELGAGTTVAQAGGGILGITIPIRGGMEISGGAGYPAGAPTLIRTDLPAIGNSEEDSAHLFTLQAGYLRISTSPTSQILI
jgi:hypothetical protein